MENSTQRVLREYSRSAETSPTRSTHHTLLVEQTSLNSFSDISCQNEDEKAPNQDCVSGLQEALTENKARLAAILGVGMALDKAYSKRSGTTTEDKKEQRVVVNQLNQDNHVLRSQLSEKTRLFTEKSKVAEKASADVQQLNSQLATKNNNLAVIVAHVNAVETLIYSLASSTSYGNKSPQKSPATSVGSGPSINGMDADLFSPNSSRFISMISQLSQVKSNNVKRCEDLNNALSLVDELKAEKQLEMNKFQLQGNKVDEIIGLRKQLEQALAANVVLRKDNTR